MNNFLYDTAVLVTEVEISLLLIAISLFGVFLLFAVLKGIYTGLKSEYEYYKRTKREKKFEDE